MKVNNALLKQMAVGYTSYSEEGRGEHQLLAHKTCEYQVPDEGERHPELEPTLPNEMSVSLLGTRISFYHSSGKKAGGASGDERTCYK